MKEFWLCFVPLFVAVDAFGTLPLYIGLTEGLDGRQKRRVLCQSVFTAMAVAIVFLFLGQQLFSLLGITVADFMIAGGILLFSLSLIDLLSMQKQTRQVDPQSLGAVPLGVPLVVGPAVLATVILLANEHGRLLTIAATLINILIAGGLFWCSKGINRMLGETGTRTISKIAGLILAAIAVMMVRKGIFALIDQMPDL